MIVDNGRNNRVIGADAFLDKVSITFRGDDNEVVFGANFQCRDVRIQVKPNGTRTVFGDDCKLIGSLTLTHNSHNAKVTIGDRLQVNGSLWISCAGPGRSITLGNDCLIASARMRTSDHHKILSMDDRKLLNPPGDIVIHDKVWLGEDVLVLKGADIGSGSVIGARSLVSKAVPENVLAAGNPLKVLRERIIWEY